MSGVSKNHYVLWVQFGSSSANCTKGLRRRRSVRSGIKLPGSNSNLYVKAQGDGGGEMLNTYLIHEILWHSLSGRVKKNRLHKVTHPNIRRYPIQSVLILTLVYSNWRIRTKNRNFYRKLKKWAIRTIYPKLCNNYSNFLKIRGIKKYIFFINISSCSYHKNFPLIYIM